jgi:phosphoglycerol transferase MdoB-like AlkP superfamily enzyme
LWLGVLLIGTKAVHLGLPEFTLDGLIDYARFLTIVTSSDIVFALLVGLVAQCAFWCTTRQPWTQWALWGALNVFCLVSVVYAVVSVQIFSYLQSPLTYPLIYLASDVKNMRSSVTAFASGPLVMAIMLLPLLYSMAVWATHRFIQPQRTRDFRIGQLACSIVLLAVVSYGKISNAAAFRDRNDRRIAENPHWTLVTSCVSELLGIGSEVQLNEEFTPEYLDDFRIVSERPETVLPPAPFQHRPRNVIVVVLESTSARYLDIYNGPYKGVSPRLLDEAAHSMIYDNFYCHVGLTANCVVAVALSIYPGMTWREYTIEHPRLPGTTLAQMLRPHGYRTAFIHNGDLEYTNQRGFLTNRGFDDLWDYHHLDGGKPDPDGFSWGVADRHLVDGMFKWIDQEPDKSKPFCLVAWTIQAHHPYTVPVQKQIDFFQGNIPPGDDYSLDLYLNALHESDREIGRLLDGLRSRGIADDTLVVITGDHGEAFGHPHDTYGHGAKIYQENVQVPLVLWNPKMFSGERADTVGSQIDLNPTIMHLMGMEPAESWQGNSLFDPERPNRAYFYAANDDYWFGVRDGRWKYIYNATIGRDMLFDIAEDPEEQRDVAGDHPDLCRDLRRRLAAWMKYEKQLLETLHGAAAE